MCSGLERQIAISASRFNRLNSLALGTISISSWGCRSVSARTRGARKTLPNPSGAPMRTVPVIVCTSLLAAAEGVTPAWWADRNIMLPGQLAADSYEAGQRQPGDYEAQV